MKDMPASHMCGVYLLVHWGVFVCVCVCVRKREREGGRGYGGPLLSRIGLLPAGLSL
jgi:hypothetical protein